MIGVAHEKKEKKYFKKFQILFRLCHPQATPE